MLSAQQLLGRRHAPAVAQRRAPLARPPCVTQGGSNNGAAANNGKPQGANKVPEALSFAFEPAKKQGSEPTTVAEPKTRELNIAYESEKKKDNPVKTTGLHRAPLSGGVKTATTRFDLPTPSVAVRNLVEHARFGHLCTMMSGMHHRRAGYPFGTLIDFASDGGGYPIFCLSPLAIHARNLIEEPRASLVVQMPGWTGLANARVTIFGDVYQLPPEMQPIARDIFLQKHSNERKERWVSGNFVYFRMNRIVDIYFVGGFGTVQWIDPAEYLTASPDEILLNNPNQILQVLNEQFAQDLRKLLGTSQQLPMDELNFISIDAGGVDIRVRSGSEFTVERIGFESKVCNLDEAITAVKKVLHNLRACADQPSSSSSSS